MQRPSYSDLSIAEAERQLKLAIDEYFEGGKKE